MASPFAKKVAAKKATKLKPFGAKKKRANGSSNNPFAKRARGDERREKIAEVEARIAELGKELDEAWKIERKAFKRLDKLDLAGKQGTTAHDEARSEWDKAWTQLERKHAMLNGATVQHRRLSKEKP